MFKNISLSLADITGREYINGIIEGACFFGTLTRDEAKALAYEKIDFYPVEAQLRNSELVSFVGHEVVKPVADPNDGAPTDAFRHAENRLAAPLGAYGCYRLGEDGKLYLTGKSEHYHASLGHSFPGYKLIDMARRLGIPNATHNNTRGYITRLCEKRIVEYANGISLDEADADERFAAVAASHEPHVLNRVINLETGSLGVEAGVKMMLRRFYRCSPVTEEPSYAGKTPVFLVMSDTSGGKTGNYHGTTVLTQTFRGIWNEFYGEIEKAGIYKVVPVKPNDIGDFEAKISEYNKGNYKTAGFLHEIIMMNYGALRLTKDYLSRAYELCHANDTPVLVDEIQTGMWYDGLFLFRKYGLQPDFAVIGKGFPGGEFPASRIVTTAEYDNLDQFGALVTNGQEELASLAYLITMAFVGANGDELERLGKMFEDGMKELVAKHPGKLTAAEGLGHEAALYFHTVDEAAKFTSALHEKCIDASAQLYKKNCVPAVLFKPPVISTEAVLQKILEAVDSSL